MAAPEPGPAAAFDAASDRAALLRYVLDHVLERCALPDGVSNAAHLNLDRVDVPALLASLREPGGRPDLRAATGSTAGAPSAVDASNATGTNDDSDFPPVVSFASLGIAIPSLAVKPGAAAPAPPSAADAVAPTPRRSLSLVMPLSRGVSLDAAGREAPDASGTASRQADADADAVGVAAPIPDLILPPLRGGGPFGDFGASASLAHDAETGSPNQGSEKTNRRTNAAVALCAFEALVASVGDLHAPVVDVARAALEISPAEAAASLALLAPRSRDAHEEAVAGSAARVHLRLLAEAGGCGSADAAVVGAAFGDAADPAAARARVAFARRQLAAVTETLYAARDAEISSARGSGDPSVGDPSVGDPSVGDPSVGLENESEDDVFSDAPSVGSVIEEVSRLAASALSDEALLSGKTGGGVFAAETDENTKGVSREKIALDERALASAVEALVEMVESSLDAHAHAWRYPPALAGRAYARLLEAAFDPLDEGALADDADETLAALSGPRGVGECLGVDASARHAMLAWALARRYREASVGDGLFGGKDGADAETPARRAYARALDAEAEAERDDDEDVSGNVSGNVQTRFVVSETRSSRDPYALLSAATRVLCAFKEAFDEETSSRLKEDDVALVLTHAALGPVSWWTEGALCDFYKDVDVVAAELARRLPRGPPVNGVPVKRGDPSYGSPPAITAMGFERVLGLGVAAADARAPPPRRRRVSTATPPPSASPRAARWRRARAPCPRTRRTRGSRTPRARTTWRPRARGASWGARKRERKPRWTPPQARAS